MSPHLGRFKMSSLRACLHDSGMTFITERVHSIPIHFFVSVYMIPRRKSSHSEMSSFPFSFLNESFVLEWHFILVSCKHRTNFVSRWNRNSWNHKRTPQFEFRAKFYSIYCLPKEAALWSNYSLKLQVRPSLGTKKSLLETCAILFWSRTKTAHVKMPLVQPVDSVM